MEGRPAPPLSLFLFQVFWEPPRLCTPGCVGTDNTPPLNGFPRGVALGQGFPRWIAQREDGEAPLSTELLQGAP